MAKQAAVQVRLMGDETAVQAVVANMLAANVIISVTGQSKNRGDDGVRVYAVAVTDMEEGA